MAQKSLILDRYRVIEEAGGLVLGVSLDDWLQGLEHLGDGLDELGLLGVLRLHLLNDILDVTQCGPP